jgi:hypothetical protein
MKQTCEIIADLKDGKEVDYEELKLACLVQSFIIFQYKNDVKNLLKGGISAELTKKMNYTDSKTSSAEMGISTTYWNAMKKPPIDFLSPGDIPNTDEWKIIHSIHEKIYNNIMSKLK